MRALAAIVGCDIHPINNRRILETLRKSFGADEAAINAWCGTWISAGFDAYEVLLAADTQRGAFSFGHTPTIADVYLILQTKAHAASRSTSALAAIAGVEQACMALPASCAGSACAPARRGLSVLYHHKETSMKNTLILSARLRSPSVWPAPLAQAQTPQARPHHTAHARLAPGVRTDRCRFKRLAAR